MRALVAELLLAGSTADWVERFNAHRIMCAPVNDSVGFLREPHVEQLGLFEHLTQPGIDRPVPIPGLPGPLPIRDGSRRSVSPLAGADTADVLAEYGFSPAEVDELLAAGVVTSFAPATATAE
ncbi:CoA transferase [Pseudonocardia benzenivorans]